MSTRLDDKVIVITGAGNGIGRDIAFELAGAGAHVVVNDLGTTAKGEGQNAGPAQTVADAIVAQGGQALANTDSVAEWASASRIIECALDHYGRIDGVVNNAGFLRDRFFFNMDIEEWRAVLDVHLNGTFYCSRAAAPHFRKQNGGSFVNMTSTAGMIGNFGQANYAAAKAGIIALSKSMALDLHKYGVRSNCVSPFAWSRLIGSIPTDTPDQQERVERMKVMETRKIAPLVRFLASDAGADVTGQIFTVRANEIFLMSQSRPLRSVHESTGWTADSIATHAMPALRKSFYPLDRTQDIFDWDPI